MKLILFQYAKTQGEGTAVPFTKTIKEVVTGKNLMNFAPALRRKRITKQRGHADIIFYRGLFSKEVLP